MVQINVKAVASVSQAESRFAALRAEVAALNKELAATSLIPSGGSPEGFARTAAAVKSSTKAFQDALAASGAFRVEQLRVNDAISENTKLLQRQKLNFKDTFGKKNRNMMKQVYLEQLAMQKAIAMNMDGVVGDGKSRFTVGVPTKVDESWDTLNNRIGMFRYQLKSASAELINWGKNTQWAGRQLMAGITFPVAAFGAAAGVMAYQTDKAFAQIAKVYDFSAAAMTEGSQREIEMNQLKAESYNLASQAAKDYGSSIMDTLAVEQALAATGLNGQKLFDSTRQVQRISTLGDIDQNETVEMVVALQTAFKDTIQDGQDLNDTLNFMNAASNATSLSLQDIAQATPRAATAIAQLGGDAREMTVLLVSMREAGINAAEGANALKSFSSRILNPAILEKAQSVYDKFGAGIDIKAIADQAQGNMFQFIKLLGEANEANTKLTDSQKQAAIAALAGTYQFNRISAAVENMGAAFADGGNQTAKAIEIMNMGAEELQNTADLSLKTVTDSAANRFKAGLEAVKLELARFGEPFLAVASTMLNATTALLGFINSLPDGAKKGLAFAAIFAAIVGPLVMLTGLFANFAGNIGKFVGSALRLVSTFEIVNKSQLASRILASETARSFMTEAQAVQALTQEIQGLQVALQTMQAPLVGAGVINPVLSGEELLAAQRADELFPRGKDGRRRYRAGSVDENGKKMGGKLIAEDVALQKAMAAQTEQVATNTARTRMNMVGGAAAAAGMAAGIGLMVAPAGAVGDEMGKWLMIASIVGPSIGMIAPLMGKAAAATRTAAVAAGAFAANQKIAFSAARSSGTLIPTIAKGLRAAAFSAGGVGAAVTLAVGGLVMWKNHMNKVREEQIATQKALVSTTEKWASAAGKVYTAIRDTKIASSDINLETPMKDRIDNWKQDKEGMKAISGLSGGELIDQGLIKYVELIDNVGLSAGEAQEELKAMFLASNSKLSNNGALMLLNSVLDKLGGADDTVSRKLSAFISGMDSINFDNDETIKSSAAAAGESAAEAFASAAGDPKQSKEVLDALGAQFKSRYKEFYSNLSDDNKKLADELGDGTMAGLLEAVQGKPAMEAQALLMKFGKELFEGGTLEASFFKKFDELFRAVGGEIKSVDDIFNNSFFTNRTLTVEGSIARIQHLIGSAEQDTGMWAKAFGPLNDAYRLNEANQILANYGLEEAKSLTQAESRLMQYLAAQTGDAADEARDLANQLRSLPTRISVKVDIPGAIQAVQTGMSQTQSDIASALTSSLDARLNAQRDAMSAAADARRDALSAAQERQDERFEKKWEKRNDRVEAAYDRRIEKVEELIEAEEKAEERRQKMFEAEMTRIDRLAEAQTRSVDFNLALQTGDLDEAARLRIEGDAAAQQWALADASKDSATGSERRIKRLENQQDRLEDEKDAALDALKEKEKAERKHLDKIQDMRSKALDKSIAASSAAFDRQAEMQRASLDQQLATFRSFVPKNMKELKQWMKEMGIEYTDFGEGTLKPTSQTWGEYFRDSYRRNVRNAALEIASDKIWADIGEKASLGVLQGMGFSSLSAFQKFVETGNLPDDFGKVRQNYGSNANRSTEEINAINRGRHEGGMIDDRIGSRKGVARNVKGLHSSEVMVRALKGERMMSREAVAKYGPELEAMHNGTYRSGTDIGGMIGYPGAIAGAFGRVMALKAAQSFRAVKQQADATANAVANSQGFFGGPVSGFRPGIGGKHRPIMGPVTSGLHGGSSSGDPLAVDMAGPSGRPVYAVSDGIITQSRDIAGPLATDRYRGDGPYGSFGRMITMQTAGGANVLYAHLSRRSVSAGTKVKGGSVIGYSGNTGNSSGPHLHFGASNGPLSWLAKGGTIDGNGIVGVHDQETVLTKSLSKDMTDTISALGRVSRKNFSWESVFDNAKANTNVANASGNHYTISVTTDGNDNSEQIANLVIEKIRREENRKPKARKVSE